MIHDAFINGLCERKLVEALIVLISKLITLNISRTLDQYVFVMFPIKVLINRLRPFLNKIICLLQGSFVLGEAWLTISKLRSLSTTCIGPK